MPFREILGKEQEIPEDGTQLKKWIENIRTFNTRLFFPMRIKTINIDGVKNAVFSWCKGNSRWVDFTKLSSSRIFTGGCFHNIHPFFYTRDDFCEYIYLHLPQLRGKLDIYHKTVWKRNDNKERIITPAIVIDGEFEVKDEAMNFLYTHVFKGRYKNVTFVPYKSNDLLTSHDQIELMKSNNAYQAHLARMIFKVSNATEKHNIAGRTFSFQEWLCNLTIDKKHLIEGVEVAPDDVVFHTDHIGHVKHAINNLYQHAEQVFGKALTAQLLDRENLQRAKSSHEMEREHSKKLKSIQSNPQGSEDSSRYSQPKQTKARGYYGTYLEVAQGTQPHTSEITQDSINSDDDLRKQVQEIAQAQKNLESNMTSSIFTAVNQHIHPIQTQINHMQTNHQQ